MGHPKTSYKRKNAEKINLNKKRLKNIGHKKIGLSLFEKISNIRSLLNQNDSIIVETILFGSNGLNDEENACIIESTIEYSSTGKFGSFKKPFATITSLPELHFRFRRFILLVQTKKVISAG